MQKRAAGACCTIDDLFRQDLKVLAVVGVLVTQDADRTQPPMADTNDLIAFAQRANGDRANRRIEPRHIPAAGEDADHALPGAHKTLLSFSICRMIGWRNSLWTRLRGSSLSFKCRATERRPGDCRRRCWHHKPLTKHQINCWRSRRVACEQLLAAP